VTALLDARSPSLLSGSGGAFAADLIAARLRRLVALQSDVLADHDPEPLHQMRVSFRRLRVVLEQFAPALCLPEAAEPRRIARIGRRLGLARDLDVLRQRLDQQLVPLLPERELQSLKPLFKQLRRERRLAFEELSDCLQGRRYLKLLAALQAWLKKPVYTALGEEPLLAWRSEWLQAALEGLTTLPGWWTATPYAPEAGVELHRLRRRLKRARYGLSNLQPLDPERIDGWLMRLRGLQALLGDLNDLQLIDAALHRQLDASPDQVVPGLCSIMAELREQAWQQWLVESQPFRGSRGRMDLHALALISPST
jgi:CHAD domain-containing protein